MFPPKKERYPGQFKEYDENLYAGDYEAVHGESPLNIDSLEDFIALTDDPLLQHRLEHPEPEPERPRDKHGNTPIGSPYAHTKGRGPTPEFLRRMNPQAGEPLAASRPADADDTTPPTPPSQGGENGSAPSQGGEKKLHQRTRRCTKRESREREEAVIKWLNAGGSTADVVWCCKQTWGIGRRMSQYYLKRARNTMAEAASKVDYLAHLQQSREQHDRLFQRALKDLDKIDDPTKSAGMLRTATTILKARDKVMEEIRHHRTITGRDQSPDSEQAKMKRQDIISMPLDEMYERLENMRNNWWYWWKVELDGNYVRDMVMNVTKKYEPGKFEEIVRRVMAEMEKETSFSPPYEGGAGGVADASCSITPPTPPS